MAIYKPSNCAPFLDTVDLSYQQDISCEINTNNSRVVGYKIKILDNKNNVIFEGSDYSPIKVRNGDGNIIPKYMNSGLNGSMLVIPFVDDLSNKGNYSDIAQKNIIFTENGEYKNQYNGYIFSNGSINQPYKWQIFLCQGTDENGMIKFSEKDYDMSVSSGNVLGSTSERIQTYFSDNIFSDYYVQLYDDSGNQVSNRALIKSYDHSYGFMYLQNGALNNSAIESANYISVFKDTNDPQYVTKSRVVQYQADTLDVDYGGGRDLVGPLHFSESSKNIFIQVYNGEIKPAEITIDKYASGQGTGVLNYGDDATTFLVTGKPGTDSEYSVFNGVFQLYGAPVTTEDPSGAKQTTLTWIRSSQFSTYANFIDRTICVKSLGKNYQSTATADNLGTINETKLMFFEEQPIGLYPIYEDSSKEFMEFESSDAIEMNWSSTGRYGESIKELEINGNKDFSIQSISVELNVLDKDKYKVNAVPIGGNKYKISVSSSKYNSVIMYAVKFTAMETKGAIFKNSIDIDTNEAITYIKPNIYIGDGMRFYYGNGNFDNYSDIKFVDNIPNSSNKYSATWYIKYDTDVVNNQPLIPSSSYSDGTQYEIRSNYKISDENPIYCYDKPSINIKINGNETSSDTIFVVNNRQFNAIGEYSQSNNKQWKKYQWVFENLFINERTVSPVSYDGEISFNAIGLQNGYSYVLTLTVEDELGYVISKTINIDVRINNILEDVFDVNKQALNCDTQSIDISFERNGYIIPTYFNEYAENSVSYDGNSIEITRGEEADSMNYIVRYNNISTDGVNIVGNLIESDTNNYTMVSSHKITAKDFAGGVIGYSIEIGEYSGLNDARAYLEILVPDETRISYGSIVANDDRNKLKYSYKIQNRSYNSQGEEVWNDSQVIMNREANLQDGELYKNDPVVFSKNKDGVAKDGYDYLQTDVAYTANGDIKDGYVNQFGKYNTSKSDNIEMPGTSSVSETEENNTVGYWSDRKLSQIQQADGSYINVVSKNEYNIWHDRDENGNVKVWHDKAMYEVYEQKDVVSHTGREKLSGVSFTTQIAVKGFDVSIDDSPNVEISAKCYKDGGATDAEK